MIDEIRVAHSASGYHPGLPVKLLLLAGGHGGEMMIATCGHDIGNEFVADTVVVVKGVTREGVNAVSVRTACKKCREDYERVGLVLHNPDEESAWLKSKEVECIPAN